MGLQLKRAPRKFTYAGVDVTITDNPGVEEISVDTSESFDEGTDESSEQFVKEIMEDGVPQEKQDVFSVRDMSILSSLANVKAILSAVKKDEAKQAKSAATARLKQARRKEIADIIINPNTTESQLLNSIHQLYAEMNAKRAEITEYNTQIEGLLKAQHDMWENHKEQPNRGMYKQLVEKIDRACSTLASKIFVLTEEMNKDMSDIQMLTTRLKVSR